jgi:hypothetical protein
MKNFIFYGLIAVAVIAFDYVKGPIFPDKFYCFVQAGTELNIPGSTRATSWSANDGCDAYKRGCATGYTTTAPSSACIHTTLWDAYRKKFGLAPVT